jgi:hypothetical protein
MFLESTPLCCIFFYGVSFWKQVFGYREFEGARSMGAEQALGQVLSISVCRIIGQRKHFLSK